MNRGDLLYAFTKIALWRQTQFRKIVYIDADVVTLRAPDELFDLPDSFAAAPDVGWPDIFNTGVMVLKPYMGDYWALKTLASSGDTFDGADQGLLNQYFEHKDWHRLSFTYNTTPSANYQYEPAYRYYKSRISMVHFIGKEKPWMTTRSKNAAPGAFNELLYRWWAVYDAHFQAPVCLSIPLGSVEDDLLTFFPGLRLCLRSILASLDVSPACGRTTNPRYYQHGTGSTSHNDGARHGRNASPSRRANQGDSSNGPGSGTQGFLST